MSNDSLTSRHGIITNFSMWMGAYKKSFVTGPEVRFA
jgi:hypothetical protein